MEISKAKVIEHFGTVDDAARFFGISRQAIYQWPDRGSIPRSRALELQLRVPQKFGAAATSPPRRFVAPDGPGTFSGGSPRPSARRGISSSRSRPG